MSLSDKVVKLRHICFDKLTRLVESFLSTLSKILILYEYLTFTVPLEPYSLNQTNAFGGDEKITS